MYPSDPPRPRGDLDLDLENDLDLDLDRDDELDLDQDLPPATGLPCDLDLDKSRRGRLRETDRPRLRDREYGLAPRFHAGGDRDAGRRGGGTSGGSLSFVCAGNARLGGDDGRLIPGFTAYAACCLALDSSSINACASASGLYFMPPLLPLPAAEPSALSFLATLAVLLSGFAAVAAFSGAPSFLVEVLMLAPAIASFAPFSMPIPACFILLAAFLSASSFFLAKASCIL